MRTLAEHCPMSSAITTLPLPPCHHHCWSQPLPLRHITGRISGLGIRCCGGNSGDLNLASISPPEAQLIHTPPLGTSSWRCTTSRPTSGVRSASAGVQS